MLHIWVRCTARGIVTNARRCFHSYSRYILSDYNSLAVALAFIHGLIFISNTDVNINLLNIMQEAEDDMTNNINGLGKC